MHIVNSIDPYSSFGYVHNLPKYFQYAKGQEDAEYARALAQQKQKQQQQQFKPISPSRNKPSSLNTQLYTAENFMKISSPRRGCYMYNSNNNISNSTNNESKSESKQENGGMDVEEGTTFIVSQNQFNNNNYNNQQQSRVNKRKSFHDENNLFIEEFPNLQKRQRLVVPKFDRGNYNNNNNNETQLNLFNQKLNAANVINNNNHKYGMYPSAGWF